MCILVVDDEPLVLMMAVDGLEDAGHKVLSAGDVAAATRLIEARPGHFTCLVTDYHMPGGLSGADLIERMRADYPTIPMLLATALGNAVSGAWRKKYRTELLVKPFGPQTLVDRVNGMLGKT